MGARRQALLLCEACRLAAHVGPCPDRRPTARELDQRSLDEAQAVLREGEGRGFRIPSFGRRLPRT